MFQHLEQCLVYSRCWVSICSVDTCFIHKRMAVAAICGQSDSSNFRAVFLFYTKRLFMSPTPIGTIASSLFSYKTSWFNAQIVLAVVTRKSFRVTRGFFQYSFSFSFSLSSPLHFLFSPTSSPFHYLPPPSLFPPVCLLLSMCLLTGTRIYSIHLV